MESSILIATYLAKDTLQRWLEQPASVLARILITVIMASLTMVLLVVLQLQISALEKQRKAFGLNRLVLTEFIEPGRVHDPSLDHQFKDIAHWGELLTLKQYPVKANISGQQITVISYNADAPSTLTQHSQFSQFLLMTTALPVNILVDVTVENREVKAITVPVEERFSSIADHGILFIPDAVFPKLGSRGFTLWNLLETPLIDEVTAALRARLALDRNHRVKLRSSANLRDQIDALQTKQRSWRFIMAGFMGAALALIYGVLATLEYRQNAYVSALMRSFGVSSSLLSLRTFLENSTIAIGAASGSLFLLSTFHQQIFTRFGMGADLTKSELQDIYFGPEAFWLLLFVLVGVLLSCIPVAIALKKPVGQILE